MLPDCELEPTVVAIARSRTDLAALEAQLDLAPVETLACLRDADARIRGRLDGRGVAARGPHRVALAA